MANLSKKLFLQGQNPSANANLTIEEKWPLFLCLNSLSNKSENDIINCIFYAANINHFLNY
jgi:hypothetical protein